MDSVSLRQDEDDLHVRMAMLVEEVSRRREAGELVCDETIVNAHAEMMPELGEMLRALRVAENAERRARQRTPSPLISASRAALALPQIAIASARASPIFSTNSNDFTRPVS